jgi:ribosome-binding protein aMBF1 (putative translation factor)
MELSGITITEKEKKRLLNESVSMVEIPKNRTQVVPKKPQQEPHEDEIGLDEILREMGYYDDEEDDLREDFTDEVEEDDSISNMSREELKQMIQDIVLDTMDEEEELYEIIENLTKNY